MSLRFLFVAQGQVTSLYHVSCPPKLLKRVFLMCMDFSCSCRILGKGDPCLEFSMAVSDGSGTQRLQPAATSNHLPAITNLETKHDVVDLDTCAHFIHAGHRPDPHRPVAPPRCQRIQIIPSRQSVQQAPDIHTSRGTVQYCTVVHV